MNTRRLCFLLLLFSLSSFAAEQSETVQKPESGKSNPSQVPKPGRIRAARCDAQLGGVCVITIERLAREERGRKHLPIGVVRDHVVVWVSEKGQQFKFDKFQRVECSNEKKVIDDPNDPGPFENPYGPDDKLENVKYSKVTGKIGNCYKHMIEVEGKGKIDPHVIIEGNTP
jgi:hypothetical protein